MNNFKETQQLTDLTPLQRCYTAIAATGQRRLATRSPAQLHTYVQLTVQGYLRKQENQDKPMDVIEAEILQHPYSLNLRALILELDGDNDFTDKAVTKWILRLIGKEISK